jgi:hypothetical protein
VTRETRAGIAALVDPARRGDNLKMEDPDDARVRRVTSDDDAAGP